MTTPLFTGAEWTFDTLQRIHDTVETIAVGEMGLDIYPNQIEVITAEQMLDAYAASGMPIFYKHWSFGKRFVQNETVYRKGLMGLAYEIVINSSPCISYLMEENTATMQTLVIAHAAFGHNHFFKSNAQFRQWTDAGAILSYLEFARRYVADCEERYGEAAVERVLDAAHALMSHGIHRSPRRRRPDLRLEEARQRDRRAHEEAIFNDLWRTVPTTGRSRDGVREADAQRQALLELPQENLLYFLEKTAPKLTHWQRECLRIVRMIAQYFYPQRQTKMMNEGCATFVHHRIMTALHERGYISDGNYLEFLTSHTNVILQLDPEHPAFSGWNPYALGFALCEDIERIATNPTDEDRVWFPDLAGSGDGLAALKEAWANYRDDSFIQQFLSPHLIRKLRLFQLRDDPDEEDILVTAIHDERGYRDLRRALARSYEVDRADPDIQVVDVRLDGDRRLVLQHLIRDGRLLAESDARRVLQHTADLWGYDVLLQEVTSEGDVEKEHLAGARPLMGQ